MLTVVLMHPILGLFRLWAVKTLGTTTPDDIRHQAAEVVSVVS